MRYTRPLGESRIWIARPPAGAGSPGPTTNRPVLGRLGPHSRCSPQPVAHRSDRTNSGWHARRPPAGPPGGREPRRYQIARLRHSCSATHTQSHLRHDGSRIVLTGLANCPPSLVVNPAAASRPISRTTAPLANRTRGFLARSGHSRVKISIRPHTNTPHQNAPMTGSHNNRYREQLAPSQHDGDRTRTKGKEA